MGNFKEKTGKTRVGTFIQKTAPWLLDVAGDLTGVDALNELSEVIQNDGKMSPEEKAMAIELLQLDINDRDSARKMQQAALQQGDLFSKRFVYYLAGFIMLVLAALLILLFYVQIPKGNGEVIYMAIGMFLGIASTVAAFFFGSSSGSKEKQEGINRIMDKIK